MNARVGILLVALPAMLAAQAMVEAALAGHGVTSAAPAQKAGQAVGTALGGLGRALEPAGIRSRSAKSVAAKPAVRNAGHVPARPPKSVVAPSVSVFPPDTLPALAPESKAEPAFEDPSGIEKGMEYADLVRRFGPPSLKLTTGPGDETLSYAKRNASVNVTVRNGKVTAVRKAGG